MSFTPPNHARALSLALFFTWLYIACVLWWHVASREQLDVLSLVGGSMSVGIQMGGSMSVGILVYGASVIHRMFLANLLPFGYNLFGTIWGIPVALVWILHILAGVIVVVSLAVIVWAWFHAHREKFNLETSLPMALVLATPIVTYELIRVVFGVDVFANFVGAFITSL